MNGWVDNEWHDTCELGVCWQPTQSFNSSENKVDLETLLTPSHVQYQARASYINLSSDLTYLISKSKVVVPVITQTLDRL